MSTHQAGWVGPRQLLRRLRDIMAGPSTAQERLDQVATVIAAEMVAEVCSIYVMRAGEVLELFATEGLNPEAVHKTRMRVGEGLIGDIAAHGRPLALADAWAYPNFSYRPETGEDIYRSMMGVPIQRGGRVLGVLAVQNKVMRAYGEEEVETLETIAMVLAELVASGELISPTEASHADISVMGPSRLEGVRLNAGLAIGSAVLHRHRVTIRQMVAEDPGREQTRLREALARVHSAIDAMLASDEVAEGSEFRAIIESYRMFAEDRGWLSRIREAIRGGLTAEAAVQKVQNDMRARLREVSDAYLKERLLDLEDLTGRLQIELAGGAAPAPEMPDNAILVARSMGPAELLDYDRKRVRGLVLEEGSATAHVAIIARALEIPVVGRVKDVLDRVDAGDTIIVDGDNAQVFIRPAEDVLDNMRVVMGARSEQRARFRALRDTPAITRDGKPIRLMLNAGLLSDIATLDETGADGIGLFRTEIPFMVREDFPRVEAQTELYAKALDLAGSRPILFRTLDVGGDKVLPYFPIEGEANPAMGWRALRIGLDRPLILRQQLRALIHAAAGRALSVMFPMVSTVAEFRAARTLLHIELARAEAAGRRPPAPLKLGAMIEVPALAWQMPALLAEVDFLSVGSNDLLQFLFASDRGDPRVGDRYDTLAPAALACLRDLVVAADAAGVPISICGEMAGRPLEAMALLGLGFRSLSMTPGAHGLIKLLTLSIETDRVQDYLLRLRDSATGSLREPLRAFARDHGYPVSLPW